MKPIRGTSGRSARPSSRCSAALHAAWHHASGGTRKSRKGRASCPFLLSFLQQWAPSVSVSISAQFALQQQGIDGTTTMQGISGPGPRMDGWGKRTGIVGHFTFPGRLSTVKFFGMALSVAGFQSSTSMPLVTPAPREGAGHYCWPAPREGARHCCWPAARPVLQVWGAPCEQAAQESHHAMPGPAPGDAASAASGEQHMESSAGLGMPSPGRGQRAPTTEYQVASSERFHPNGALEHH